MRPLLHLLNRYFGCCCFIWVWEIPLPLQTSWGVFGLMMVLRNIYGLYYLMVIILKVKVLLWAQILFFSSWSTTFLMLFLSCKSFFDGMERHYNLLYYSQRRGFLFHLCSADPLTLPVDWTSNAGIILLISSLCFWFYIVFMIFKIIWCKQSFALQNTILSIVTKSTHIKFLYFACHYSLKGHLSRS